MTDVSTDEFEKIPAKMKSVMLGAGVRKQDLAKTLSPVIGVSVPQAYKKLNGLSDMTLAQIEKFNLAYSIRLLSTPLTLLQGSAPETTHVYAGLFVVGDSEIACNVEVGRPGLGEDYSKKYAAYKANGTWYVEPVDACPIQGRHEVEHLNIALGGAEPSILVLDDEQRLADLLRDYLIKKGYKAAAFYRLAAAKSAIQSSCFDGYFLDWRLGDDTSEKLIEFIRETQPSAPIIVSTAGDDDVPERRAMFDALEVRYRVECHIKPTPMKVLTSLMAEALALKDRK